MSMSFETAMSFTSVAVVGANLFAESSLLDVETGAGVGRRATGVPAGRAAGSAADGRDHVVDPIRERSVDVAAHPKRPGELHRQEAARPRDDEPRGLEHVV